MPEKCGCYLEPINNVIHMTFCPMHAAAPELLEALMECIAEDGAHCFSSKHEDREAALDACERRIHAISDLARAAIAKATGQEK